MFSLLKQVDLGHDSNNNNHSSKEQILIKEVSNWFHIYCLLLIFPGQKLYERNKVQLLKYNTSGKKSNKQNPSKTQDKN